MSSDPGTHNEGSTATAETVTDDGSGQQAEGSNETVLSESGVESVRQHGVGEAAKLETRATPQTNIRRTALGLAVVGTASVVAAVVFSDVRAVLFVLGAIGLFGAVLTYFLPQDRYLSASVGSQIYTATASNQSRLAATLDLRDRYVYVPSEDSTGTPAWLFVPEHEPFEIPSPEALKDPFVGSINARKRGVSFIPASTYLFDEFCAVAVGGPSTEPTVLGEQLAAAFVDAFDLAEEIEIEAAESELTATVGGSTYADPDAFDHPIPSLFGVAFAAQLETPVEVSTRSIDDEDGTVVSCRWGAALEADAS